MSRMPPPPLAAAPVCDPWMKHEAKAPFLRIPSHAVNDRPVALGVLRRAEERRGERLVAGAFRNL